MSTIDTLLPQILPYAPGCPEPVALVNIVKAAQQFCERTRLWRVNYDIAVTKTSINVVPVPAGADLFEIERARFADKVLTPVSLSELDHKQVDWRTWEDPEPRYITQEQPGEVILCPRCEGTVNLWVFLRPADGSEELPDFIIKLYGRVIADGALAEILMTPNQPFTAPDRAQFYAARFEQRVSNLANTHIKGQQRARMRTKPQWF